MRYSLIKLFTKSKKLNKRIFAVGFTESVISIFRLQGKSLFAFGFGRLMTFPCQKCVTACSFFQKLLDWNNWKASK